VPLTFYLPAFTTHEEEAEAVQSDNGDYKAFIAYNAARMTELTAPALADMRDTSAPGTGSPASSSEVQCIVLSCYRPATAYHPPHALTQSHSLSPIPRMHPYQSSTLGTSDVREGFDERKGMVWIVKPASYANRGFGIKVVQGLKAVQAMLRSGDAAQSPRGDGDEGSRTGTADSHPGEGSSATLSKVPRSASYYPLFPLFIRRGLVLLPVLTPLSLPSLSLPTQGCARLRRQERVDLPGVYAQPSASSGQKVRHPHLRRHVLHQARS